MCIYMYIYIYVYIYMYNYIQIYHIYKPNGNSLGKFNHDLTVLPSPGIMVNKRNHPFMALFQLSQLL